MTVELVSEQKLNDNEPSYYVYLDGMYVEGSFTKNLELAQSYYDKIYKNPGLVYNVRKILQSEEILLSSKDTKTQ